jgi:putative SOS response-associated peptidase YedK
MNFFELNLTPDQHRRLLGVPSPWKTIKPNFSVGDHVIAIRSNALKSGELIPLTLETFTPRFGLVPESFTSVAGADHERYHNIRLERITYLRNVMPLYATHKCLIPATAFYRVILEGGLAKAYKFSKPGAEPFFLAGLWTINRRPQIQVTSCAVITRLLTENTWAKFGARAPVALEYESACDWLRLRPTTRGPLKIKAALVEQAFEIQALEKLPFSVDASDIDTPKS